MVLIVKSLKPIPQKKSGKAEREHKVLLGLVKMYIETGKPIGSQTLKENGFRDLSSATIRNYFANLERAGFLHQQHSSGGRIPTNKAYKLYGKEHLTNTQVDDEVLLALQDLRKTETREIAAYLQEAAEVLSKTTGLAVFLSAPRFDQDFIQDIKLVRIDGRRYLCVLVTDFGQIHTEVLHSDDKIGTFALHRMEAYFHWRLTGYGKPENMRADEEQIAQKFYNEVMVRYIVDYSNFTKEHVHQTGFSQLLKFPEFNEAAALASGLSLFENSTGIRLLLREAAKNHNPHFWIGDDLKTYSQSPEHCAVIAAPYRINQNPVGAIGVLGPNRIHYRRLFATLRLASEFISETLTRSIFKFKLRYRQPKAGGRLLETPGATLTEQVSPILLEDKSQ